MTARILGDEMERLNRSDGITVSAVQLGVVQCWSDPDGLGANTDDIVESYGQLCDTSDLVVLPELSLTGYIPLKGYDQRRKRILSSVAQQCVASSLPKLADATRGHRASLVVGIMEPSTMRHEFYNAIMLIEDGEVRATYRKIHLPVEENHYFLPGDEVVTIDTRAGRIGLSICYDIMFPEVARLSALQGAEILIVPSNWLDIANLKLAGDVLPVARAIEQQMHVVFVNGVGELEVRGRRWPLFGRSKVVAATGTTVGVAGSTEEVLTVDLSSAQLDAGADVFPILRDRRPELYTNLAAPLTSFRAPVTLPTVPR